MLGWKKKWKNAWLMNKLIFLSFCTINFDAISAMCSSIFAPTKWKEIRNSNDDNPNKSIWIEKCPFLTWLTPQLKTFVLRKGTMKIGQQCVDSLSKKLIDLSIIEIYVKRAYFQSNTRPEHFAGHKCDKKGFNVNHHNHENGSTIDDFLDLW